MIHELGHKLFFSLSKEEKKAYNKIITNKFKKYSKKDFKFFSKKDYCILKDSSEFVSSYQTRIYKAIDSFVFGKVNTDYALEYISEGVKYYFKNSNLLKEKDIVLYEFIDEVINK